MQTLFLSHMTNDICVQSDKVTSANISLKVHFSHCTSVEDVYDRSVSCTWERKYR